jgi:hypothetical protein
LIRRHSAWYFTADLLCLMYSVRKTECVERARQVGHSNRVLKMKVQHPISSSMMVMRSSRNLSGIIAVIPVVDEIAPAHQVVGGRAEAKQPVDEASAAVASLRKSTTVYAKACSISFRLRLAQEIARMPPGTPINRAPAQARCIGPRAGWCASGARP